MEPNDVVQVLLAKRRDPRLTAATLLRPRPKIESIHKFMDK